jgi:dihydrofolate reductase
MSSTSEPADSVRYKTGRPSGWLSPGMRKLIEYDHLSIDGRFSGDDWWAAQMKVAPNDNHFDYQLRLLEQASGLVLGRATYETFAATWPTMTGDLADKLNSLPKHVASTTLTETTWNAEVLAGDAIDAVAQLKESGDGTLVKYGNGPFSRALVEAGLLDELHLSISPFVAGSGESLLSGISTTPMNLTGVTDIGNGAVVLAYTPSR